jgi:hypothetical protein
MKHSLFFATLLALAPLTGQAATFSLNTQFYNGSVSGGQIMGTGTLTYEADSALANGSYSWASLTNPTLNLTFVQGPVFTHNSDFLTNPVTIGLHIQILSGNFIFTNTTSSVLWNETQFNNGYESILFASYSRGSNYAQYATTFAGSRNLVTDEDHEYGVIGVVPEPSTYGLVLGGLALAVAALRRRAKK